MNESTKGVPKPVQLKLKYPRLFLGRREELSLDIAYPRGWSLLMQDLFTRLDTLLTDDQAQAFRIEQIKEKYGTLRVYYSWAGSPAALTVDIQMPGGERLRFKQDASAPVAYPSDEVDKLIAEAERQSAITCVFCSSPGTERDDGWIYVACDACEAQRRDPNVPNPKA